MANFTPIEKAEASAFSESVYDACFMDGGFNKAELADFLEESGIWTDEHETAYIKLFDDVQAMKVDYFENFAIPSKRDRIKSAISRCMDRINTQYSNKSYLSDYTCEAARDEAYGVYLFRNAESPLLFYRKFLSARLTEEALRNLYFDHTWRMVWSISKDTVTIFGLNANSLNDNQLGLLYWSKLYDNIGEAMEPPSHSAMHDTIAVDGWLIKQSKNREAEDKKKILPTREAGEIFVPISSAREIKEINDLNGPEGKKILKSRVRDLAAKGDLDERQFSHVKEDIGIRKNELSFRNK